MSRNPVPSAPTFDDYENPDAIRKVKPTATPPPLYDEVVQEDEEEKQFVHDDVETMTRTFDSSLITILSLI